MVLSRVGVVTIQPVPIRIELAVHCKFGQPCEVEQCHERQPLGDELEILLKLYGGDHLGALVVLVALDKVGIRVDVGAILVVTEHDVLDPHVLVVHRVVGREEHRVGVHDLAIDIATSVQRALIIPEVTCQADSQLRGRGDVDVHVGAQGVVLVVDVVVETVALIDFQNTRVLGVGTGHIVGRNLASTTR